MLTAVGSKGWPDHVDLMRRLGGHQEVGIHRAAVKQVDPGEEIAIGHVLVDGGAHKPGQNILYTSAEIPDCIPHRGGGSLYAVCTSSKSHNCCTGTGS